MILRIIITKIVFLMFLMFSVPTGNGGSAEDGETSFYYDMLEELPVGTIVADLFTDVGIPYRSVQFSITSGQFQGLFHVDAEGKLTVGERVDREKICFKRKRCFVRLDIEVVGTYPEHFFRLVNVVITIVDINDNPPAFPQSKLVLNISESVSVGTKIAVPVNAEDPDGSEFGLVRYEYSGNSSGKIQVEIIENDDHSESIYLTVVELDRETEEHYVIWLTAFDAGSPPRSGQLELSIWIEDSDDNSPRFENLLYNVSIREDFPVGVPLIRVHAHDADEGPNGQVVYGLARSSESAHGSLFHVNGRTGEVSLKQELDYDLDEREYTLSIIATGSRTQCRSGLCQISDIVNRC